MFFRPTGPAADTLKRIRRSPPCRRFKVQTRGKGECTKLIIGIGQVHPVLSGKFERFQARRIANVQGEIFALSRFLSRELDVVSFGQEGYAGKGLARFPQDMLSRLKAAARRRKDVKRVLRTTASAWRKALHKGDQKKAKEQASALNAIALLQATNKGVTMFPIEQADVHSAIGEAIAHLQHEIGQLERSSLYQSVLQKRGKGLTKEEYESTVMRNKLIKQFNKTIAHPQRDRSILREVIKHSGKDITVFILGTGHRSGFLTLAAKELPEEYLLAWLTPPSLWWWKGMLRKIGWIAIIIVSVLSTTLHP
ncbi:MAG: hypothetical protein QF793_02850 [Candidatus Peribacteraceae bacterium]|nr:hypothetical protein [bacterium]MDP6561841.1 hypothetical protein [Candidatus Peribacteraceae bacterium]